MLIYSILPFFGGLLSLLLGILVISKNKKSSVNLVLGLLCLCVFIWLFLYSLAYLFMEKKISFFLFKGGYSGVIMIPLLFFHFTVLFVQLKDKFLKICVLVFYCLALFFIYNLWLTKFFIKDLYKYFWGFYPKASFLHPFYVFYFLFLSSLGFLFLIRGYLTARKKSSIQAQRIKYIFLAWLIASFAGIDFVPNYGIAVYPFGGIFIVICISIMVFAMVRYRLMDINLIVTRTGVFVAVYSLILGIPFFVGYKFQKYLIDTFQDNWWLGPLVTSTILATIGPFVYLYFDKKAESRLLKEQRSYQNILKSASSGMIRIKDLHRLLSLIVHVVTKTVKIKHAAIYLLDQENNNYCLQSLRGQGFDKIVQNAIDAGSPIIWDLIYRKSSIITDEVTLKLNDEPKNLTLEKLSEQLFSLRAALVVPSFIDERLIGFIVLGEKLSKKIYSEDDLNVFMVLANQAALAIENAQFYEEIKQTHEQLFQAEKMATIGTMADGLSHQINNRFHALSLISGDALDFLSTFDSSNCNAETKQMMAEVKTSLEKIQNNVLQGGEVVKGLLKYSRPGESGFEQVNFKDVLKGALDMVQYKIKLGEIDIVEKIPADLPKIFGNQNQLQEVFFNLIDNAYDAIKEKQAMLNEKEYRGKIVVTANIGEDGHIEISMVDNGIGIKELDRKKMFTPFFTTKASSKKGTGLGLYVIKKIISAHNGIITIDSVYEKGTTFLIKLPLNREATPKIS